MRTEEVLLLHRNYLVSRIRTELEQIEFASELVNSQSGFELSDLSALVLSNESAVSVSSFDSSFNYLEGFSSSPGFVPRSMPEADIPAELRRNLQNQIFSGDTVYRFLVFDDGSVQFVLFRRWRGRENARYLVIHFSPVYFVNILDSLIDSEKQESIEYLIMSPFYTALVPGALAQISEVLPINDLSARMADGFTEFLGFEDRLFGITTIELGADSIHVAVSVPTFVHSESFITPTYLVFILLSLAAGMILAIYLNKQILKFGEELLMSDRYTKDMRFFTRLQSTIERIRAGIPGLQSTLQDVQFLYNDLDVLESRSPEPAEPAAGLGQGASSDLDNDMAKADVPDTEGSEE